MGRKGGRAQSSGGGGLVLTTLLRGLETYYVTAGRRPSTIRQAQVRFNALVRHFGADKDMRQVGHAELKAYVSERLKTAARATARAELITLHKAMIEAEKDGLLKCPPFPCVGNCKNPRQGFFEEKEFVAIRKELKAEIRPILDFLYLTGWRTEESTGLLWRDVDMEHGWISLPADRTKNRKPKAWPFREYPPLRLVLEAQWKAAQELGRKLGRVIPTVFFRFKDGRPVKSWRSAWEYARARAGYHGKLRHDCRRTAIRRMSRAGIRKEVQMDLVGLTTEQVWRDYNIRIEEDSEQEIRKLNRTSGGACAGTDSVGH